MRPPRGRPPRRHFLREPNSHSRSDRCRIAAPIGSQAAGKRRQRLVDDRDQPPRAAPARSGAHSRKLNSDPGSENRSGVSGPAGRCTSGGAPARRTPRRWASRNARIDQHAGHLWQRPSARAPRPCRAPMPRAPSRQTGISAPSRASAGAADRANPHQRIGPRKQAHRRGGIVRSAADAASHRKPLVEQEMAAALYAHFQETPRRAEDQVVAVDGRCERPLVASVISRPGAG